MTGDLTLAAAGFASGQPIPVRNTCDGENRSPELTWGGVPNGTVSLALIVDDPDAPRGTFVHWVVFDIPPDFQGHVLREGSRLGQGDEPREGANDFGRIGYGGPCPPTGTSHRYEFKLYALDTRLGLRAGASKQQVMHAMEGHVLAEAHFSGTYRRQKR
jgi:Raf kinase inhibitor-like YbhB/YbcL family protein